MSRTGEAKSHGTTEKMISLTLEESRNLLYQYCFAGNIDRVKRTIDEHSVDPDCEFGEALVYTIRGTGTQQEKENILLYFKSLGVSLSIREKTALKWAIKTDDLALIKFLQSQGVDIVHDVEMHIFDAALRDDTTILKYLVDEGASISGEFLEDVSSLDEPLPEHVMRIMIGMCHTED